MKLLPFEENVSVDNIGSVILHYSETGVGKSASCFDTLPGKIIYMCMERRDAKRSAVAVGRSPEDYRIAVFTDFRELLDFLNNFELKIKEAWGLSLRDISAIVLDGLTQLMVNLSAEMEDQIFDAQDNKEKKSLIAETKLSTEAYGALPKQICRALNVLCILAQQHGKIIVMNALIDEKHNEWDDTFTAEPRFEGKKFGTMYAGMCDLIGLVESRYKHTTIKDENGDDKVVSRLVFPPRVKYEREEWDNFTCKWTGKRLQNPNDPDALIQLPLDFNIILGLDGKETDEKKPVKKDTKPKQEQSKKAETKKVGDESKADDLLVKNEAVTEEKRDITNWI